MTSSTQASSQQADFVIVGSGPAGCVLANRLTEDPSVSVILLEAGGSDRSPIIQMPAAVPFAYMDPKLGWGYQAGPEPHANDRFVDEKRGRILGGSSSINAMIFNRGNPKDFEGWAAMGLPSWSWKRCLPYFQKMETFAESDAPWRGDSGPLKITRSAASFPIYGQFLQAGEQAGYAVTPDHNGVQQEGMHVAQAYIHKGLRQSASTAYVHPARQRPNLRVVTHAQVTRLKLEGTTAVGVEALVNGEKMDFHASREVILAAGAFGSPHLLMLSGIGDPAHLRSKGIDVRVSSPHVGAHLENHPGINLQFETETRHSIVSQLGPLGKVRLALEWALLRRGLGSSNFFEAGAFLKTRHDADYVNIQLEFLPLVRYIREGKLLARAGFNYWLDLSRPKSRGHVRLQSSDPKTAPSIVFNHLADPSDIEELVRGVQLVRDITRQSALAKVCKTELMPGSAIQSPKELAAWIKANVGSSYHPSGTCRMGSAEEAVVDASGRVHGAQRLRVVDASIMPRTVTANISACVFMMAEKLADEIRNKPQFPASTAHGKLQ